MPQPPSSDVANLARALNLIQLRNAQRTAAFNRALVLTINADGSSTVLYHNGRMIVMPDSGGGKYSVGATVDLLYVNGVLSIRGLSAYGGGVT